MKSAAIALTWEYWKGGWHFMAGALLGGAPLLGIMGGVVFMLPEAPDPGLRSLLHAVFFATSLFVAIFCASMAAGVPESRFTWPMTSWSIVTWPLLNGMVATVGVYLVLTFIANGVFHAGWPLAKPAMAAGCLFAICHGMNWAIQCSRDGHVTLAALLALAGGVSSLFLGKLDEAALHPWGRLTLPESAMAGAVVLLVYFAAVAGVTSARRGQPLSATDLANFLCEKLDLHRSPAQAFPTAKSAQRWLEWSEKGFVVPAGTAILVAILFLAIAWRGLRSTEIVQVICALTSIQVLANFIVGFYLGHAGPRFNIREFNAARPQSDTEMADAILWNAARSLSVGWLVWWAGVSLCWFFAAATGIAPRTAVEVLPALPGTSWAQVAWYAGLGMAGSALASWTLASLGVSLILTRQWLFHTILLTSAWGALALMSGIASGLIPNIWDWVQLATIVLILTASVAFYAAAACYRLIGWRRIGLAGISFVTLFMFALLLASQVPTPPQWSVAGFAALSALPFVAIAAAPLALSWNRHR